MHAVADRSDASRGESSGDELGRLLGLCSRGDETAFARLYDLSAPRIFGLVRAVVRDHAQSEEVTQEVYLQIWAQSARYNPDAGSAFSWMATIAHRRAVDRVRSAQSEANRETAYGLRQRPVAFDSTAEDAHRRLDGERVRRAMDGLTAAQRSALDLAYFGGYTHREVAALLNLPEGTAKTRIRDGLIRLRDILGVER